MTIQLLLITGLLMLALVVVRHMKASRRARLIVLCVLATGAYLVWQPDHANSMAHLLGVGRGADLLLYIWIVLTLSVILLLYLKIVEMNQMLTEVARRLTLLNPIPPGFSRNDATRTGEYPTGRDPSRSGEYPNGRDSPE